MLKIFFASLGPMMTMFAYIAIGFFMRKKNLLPENTGMVLSRLETTLLIPAVIFSTMLEYGTAEVYIANFSIILYGGIAIAFGVVFAVILSVFFAKKDKYKKKIYRYALTFANAAHAYPIVPLIMGGDKALFHYCLFLLPTYFATYCYGVPMLIPKENKSKNPIINLLNPTIIALILGFTFSVTGVKTCIPDFAVSVASSLKGCSGPLLMFLTGFIIAGFDFGEILNNKKVYIATILRLFIIPAIIMVILYFLGASKDILGYALFGFGCPLGLFTVVIPASYEKDTRIGSGMAAISCTASMLSLPIMYALLNTVL
ncbi:MAG: AEC family transporter [Clostridia bacterium]|nr:AEC family transporter [Clostridia bacterium]